MKPPAPETLEKMPILLLGLSSLLGAGCIGMHSIGVAGLADEFISIFPRAVLAETLAKLAAGPLLALIVSIVLINP